MNNNIKFDPMTGQPIQNNNQLPVQPVNSVMEQQIINQQEAVQTTIEELQAQSNPNQEVQIKNIPTVEQNKQDFINNVQSINQEKKEEKKQGVNFVFIITLFVVILAAIYFVFPLLLDYI